MGVTDEEYAEIKVELMVLQKQFDIVLSAIGKAEVAEKTADKALAMAQEALVIVTSGANVAEPAPAMPPLKDAFAEQLFDNPYVSPGEPEGAQSDVVAPQTPEEKALETLGYDNPVTGA